MPDPTDDPSTRFEALERRVAHQDLLLDDLNATVTAQWRRIDALSRMVEQMADHVRDLGRREPGSIEAPPPHY